ncbi:Inactive TPR repeat-containing thioredoxin TTL3 [Sesamum angolense]|uniref:Inactive TPR repeat-containing thioredoxin TTL3 n=1 Tax=Sesamum angolense TaxID=2727404 RepID=A0AAE1T4N3_9LAMI|nr:Inactive TPR repeat-containing thioredoxin TTL3 [Sesamum angolense]
MGEISGEKTGCGFLRAVFGRRVTRPRRSTSTGSLPQTNLNNNNVTRFQAPRAPEPGKISLRTHPILKRIRNSSGCKPAGLCPGPKGASSRAWNLGRARKHDYGLPEDKRGWFSNQGVVQQRNVVWQFRELETAGNNDSSNAGSNNVLDNTPTSAKDEPVPINGKYSTSVMGNVVKKNEHEPEKPVSLCRALSTRMDPEELKILGNEDYKNGRFAEAVALYDAAISINPNKASYRSNKSAALVALGKLLEAAFECREAIRIEPFYQRAHNRLATLYVRLGEAEKAVYHFKQSGPEADPDAMNNAKTVQIHLNKCTDAKKRGDWNGVLRETSLSIEAGADSAPLIFGLKAEALLKLNRREEAIQTMQNCPNFDIDDCTKFFGPIGSASVLVYRAQFNLVTARFDDAVAAAKRATKLDPNNMEATTMLRRTKAVASARANGNELFKVARYSEASIAYGEGLSYDPYNAVLLCNRAACKTKLGQYQKALDDCNAALNARPNYSKARLRRAYCYAKMEKWGACVQDCEVLLRENPDDEEVQKLLEEAKTNLQKHGGSLDTNADDSPSTSIVVVSSKERFRDYVTSPGTSVVLFCKKAGDRKTMQLIEQLNQRYPSINFLKVEVDDHPSLASPKA